MINISRFFISLNGDHMININNPFYSVCNENGYEIDRLYLKEKGNKRIWPHTECGYHTKVLQYAINNNLKIKYKKIHLGCYKCNIDIDFANFINRELLVSDGI